MERARAHMKDGELNHFAEQVAEHKRDPYSLVEEILSTISK